MMDGIKERIYAAIDLKSFYASVECVERGLDPLDVNLVVADRERTEKTICLAVSPALKAYGIPGRPRLFEVTQKVRQVNQERKYRLRGREFTGKSCRAGELAQDQTLELDFITAPPRMSLYMDYSSRIYQIYLKYIAPEDIHVYSIDEVFMDLTSYLTIYKMTAKELVMKMIREVLETTGITATGGIGTNLYLSKVAMDIVAKHIPADKDGVRIAELDERSYRLKLWNHTPLTDFWRVGQGYAKKLQENGMFTMGDVARCSVGKTGEFFSEDLLFKLFGINAELLIDHAWGYEPCTIEEIKKYKPENNSTSQGQVLQHPYDYEKTRIVVREMTEALVLDLVEKGLVTDQIVLTIGYDKDSLNDPEVRKRYSGEVQADRYGRTVPKQSHGSRQLGRMTSSTEWIMKAMLELFEQVMDPLLLSRRIGLAAVHVLPAATAEEKKADAFEQLDLFTDYEALERQRKEEEELLAREKNMQKAVIDIKKKFGKNAIIRGTDLQEGATSIARNNQIGGHKA